MTSRAKKIALMRAVAAGGIGAKWANLARRMEGLAPLAELTQNRDTAARALEAQSADWNQLTRDRATALGTTSTEKRAGDRR